MSVALYLAGKALLGLFFSTFLAALGYLTVSVTLISLGYLGPVAVRVAVFTGPVTGAALGGSWALFGSDLTWKGKSALLALTFWSALLGSWVALQYAHTIPRSPSQHGTPALAGVILGAAVGANIPTALADVWRALRRGRV